jgi:uncharacterized protein YndB with AHSA1/START domain
VEQTAEHATVEQTVEIEASPETVWEFLTDPEKAKRWWGPEASFDATPGGEFRLRTGSGAVAAGTFLEVERPRRLVYTFGWEQGGDGTVPVGSTTVEIVLESTPDGTTLTLVHRGLEDAAAGTHGVGWKHYLSRLAIVAGGGDPGPDDWERVIGEHMAGK